MLKPPTTSRAIAIDHIKAVAIIAVVLHHCWGWNGQITSKHYWLTQWCVLAFLYCSGYLESITRDSGIDRTYILKLFRRLGMPFLAIGLVMISVRQLTEKLAPKMVESRFPASFAGKLWDHVTLTIPTVAYPLYFLILLLFIKLFFGSWRSLMTRIYSARWIQLTPLVLLFVIASYGFLLGPLNLTGWGRTAGWSLTWPALFSYSWGFMAAESSRDVTLRISLALILLIVTLAAALQSTMFLYLCVPYLCHSFLKVAVNKIPTIGVLLSFLAFCSGTIFAWHAPFVLNTSLKLALRLQVNEFTILTLAVVLTVVVCCFIHFCLMRIPILRWLRV